MTAVAKRKIHWAIWAVPLGLLLAAGAIHGIMMLIPAPADLDLSRTQTSANGSFVASVEPGTIAVGPAMTWTFEVTDTTGDAIEAGTLRVDGGMPLHGHGLPATPSEPMELGDGRFEVQGLQFSMGGWWVVEVHRTTPEGVDTATFNFVL